MIARPEPGSLVQTREGDQKVLEPDLRLKVVWGGREWYTRSDVDAQLLVGMLENAWPDATIEVWELVAMGFFDEVRGLNVDGHGWQQVAWDGSRFARIESDR
jgi:hypothetical protein